MDLNGSPFESSSESPFLGKLFNFSGDSPDFGKVNFQSFRKKIQSISIQTTTTQQIHWLVDFYCLLLKAL